MNILGLGGVVEAVGKVADDLFTSDEEKAKIAIEERKIEAALQQGQIDVNKEESKHASVFVAGWRPAIGWCGVAAMGYQFVLYPLLVWIWAVLQSVGYVPATFAPPPMLDTDALWVILTGILGIGGLRTVEKSKGVTK